MSSFMSPWPTGIQIATAPHEDGILELGVLLSLMSVALPWLAGGLIAVVASAKIGGENRGDLLIAFGAGSAFSFPVAASLVWLLSEVEALNSSVVVWTSLALLTLVCIIAGKEARRPSLTRITSIASVGLGIIALQVSVSLWLAVSAPLQGWDSLDHWGSQAHRIVESIKDPQTVRGPSDHSHPHTVSLILSWSAIAQMSIAEKAQVSNGGGVSWVLCSVSIFVLICGWSVRKHINTAVVSWGLIFLVTAPLFQNHMVLTGYSEIFVSLFTALSLIAGFLLIKKITIWNITFFLCALLVLAFLRNTALFYSIVIFISAFVALILKNLRASRMLLIFGAVTIAAMACLMMTEWTINFRGLDYGYKHVTSEVIIANSKHGIEMPSLSLFRSVLTSAIFENASFGVIALISMASLLHLACHWRFLESADALVIIVWIGFGLVAVVSLCLPYGLSHSLPGADTFFSRSLLPLCIASLMLAITAVSAGVGVDSINGKNFEVLPEPKKM